MIFRIHIQCYNHYTNQSFPTGHHGSICHVGAGQPTWPIVHTLNWLNWLNCRSTAFCPDSQQANLAFRPKFCPDWQPGSIRIIRGPFWPGPLIIPSEARSKFPDFGHLVSRHILPSFGPSVFRWTIWHRFSRVWWLIWLGKSVKKLPKSKFCLLTVAQD